MINGKFSRRNFFKKTATGSVGLVLGGAFANQLADLWVAKAEHGTTALDLHEMVTLGAITAQIIPTDETPGAREVGIVDFIDNRIKGVQAARERYQKGLREVDDASKTKFGSPFVELAANQQHDILQSMEQSDFFKLVWRDTVEGFVRSSVGKQVVGYLGRAQPHGYPNVAEPPADH